ncbi:MAG: hemerythrin domain-containing protein [Phycisphaerae bacterium]|nr:hemerythrin domain-containing protein [Phycisphaerae bacterium]
MNYSPAIQILADEHDVILGVLEALETMAERENVLPFPQDFYEKAFDFFPTFADKCHHAKEEGHLFPKLRERGIPQDGGPIGCMLHEHDTGRAHVVAIREALRATANNHAPAEALVRREALAYAALLRQHIYKENEILFVMGDRVMTEQDKTEVLQKFNCAVHATLPAGSHEKYLALARELRATAGLPAEYSADPDRVPPSPCGHGQCPEGVCG